MPDSPSVANVLAAALSAYESLTALGEEIEDEWGYVNDLAAAWRERLEAVVTTRGEDVLPPGRAAAIERLIGETERISDPHRAIDWLSTFPQVVLVALGERP
ncbi:MAG: hypothetical protein WKF56_07630 [Candidatus Limnocylindrales bacterium]